MQTDEELVTLSMGGDSESFNQLVLRWERPIYALAYRTLGREDEARDVCQETFLRAYRALPGFKGEAKFSSWIYRIALNLCRDWMRKKRRTPVMQAPEGVDLADLADRAAILFREAGADALLQHRLVARPGPGSGQAETGPEFCHGPVLGLGLAAGAAHKTANMAWLGRGSHRGAPARTMNRRIPAGSGSAKPRLGTEPLARPQR